MSWFSLTLQGKANWDFHSFITSVCSGEIVGKKVFAYFVQNNVIHQYFRERVSTVFATVMAPQIDPVSQDLADKIIKRTSEKDKFKELSKKLKFHFKNISKNHLLSLTKGSAISIKNGAKNLIGKIWKRIHKGKESISQEKPILIKAEINKLEKATKFLKKHYTSQDMCEFLLLITTGNVSDVMQKIMIASLRPLCHKAVQSSLNSIVKASAAKVYDVGIRKMISVSMVPMVYQAFLFVLESFSLRRIANDLPSSSKVFLCSAVFNLFEMSRTIWDTWNAKPERNDKDKAAVKALAMKFAHESLERKLKKNPVLSFVGVTQDQQKMEAIVETLINETIDFYWEDLNKITYLGLPLVS